MMLKTVRIIAIGSVSLIVLLTAALFMVDLSFIREPLNQQISQTLGRDFAIDGPLSIRIGESIHIAAADIRLAADTHIDPSAPPKEADVGNTAQTTGNALAIKTLQISIPLSALLKQPIIIDDIRLSGVQIQTDADAVGTKPTADTQQHDAEPRQRPEQLPVFVRHLQIDDLHWHHDDSARAEPLDLQLVSIVQRMQDDAVVIDAAGDINQTPLKLHLTGQPLSRLLRLKAAEFKADGEFGEISFNGSGRVKDLWQPEKPEVALQVSGPSLEYLTSRLGMREISRGSLKLDISVAPLIDQMQFNIDGQFGEFLVLSGGTFDSLRTLDNVNFSVSASGPNTRHVGALFGQSNLPEVPFNADIKLTKTGTQLLIDESKLTMGRLQLSAEGSVADIRKPGQANINAHAELPNMALFADVLNLPAGITGPIAAQVSINSETDDNADSNDSERPPATFAATLTSDYGRLLAKGQLSAAQDLSGSRAQIQVNSDTPNVLLTALGTDAPHIEPLTLQTEVALGSDAFTLRSGTLNLGNHTGNFDGQVVFGNSAVATGPHAELNLTARGNDLAGSLRLVDAPTELHHSFDIKTAITLTTRQLSIKDFSVTFGASELAGAVDVDLTQTKIEANLSGHTANLLRWASLARLEGITEEIPLDLAANAQWSDGLLTVNALELKSPALLLNGSGTLRGLPHFDGSDMQLSLDIPDMSKLTPLLGSSLPAQPLSFVAAATGSPVSLNVHTLTLKTGASNLTGSASISHPQHPQVHVLLASDMLDLRPFQVLTPGPEIKQKKSEKKETRIQVEPIAIEKSAESKKRLIPDTRIDFTRLEKFDAEVALAIKTLRFDHRVLRDLAVAASVTDGELHVHKAVLTDEQDGSLAAMASITEEDGSYHLGLRLQGSAINPGIFATSTTELATSPRYKIALAGTASGNTVREMFAQSDGFIRIEGGRGQYPAGNIQLLTNSFIDELLNKLNPFSKRQPYIDINCSVAIGKLEQGELRGDPIFVLNSKRLNIFASADIDFKTEKIGATFKTVPQKGLGLSVSNLVNPFIGVGGTLAQPYLTLNPEQTLITGGAAFATGGLSLLATSLADRFLSESDPCGAALKKADTEFTALAEKYGVDKPI